MDTTVAATSSAALAESGHMLAAIVAVIKAMLVAHAASIVLAWHESSRLATSLAPSAKPLHPVRTPPRRRAPSRAEEKPSFSSTRLVLSLCTPHGSKFPGGQPHKTLSKRPFSRC